MSIRNELLVQILSAIESGAAGGPFLKTQEPAVQSVLGEVAFSAGITVEGKEIRAVTNSYLIESTQDWIDNTAEISATKRQLISNATYEINGNVSRAFELEINGFNTIKGDNPNIDVDTYTGAGTAFVDAAAFSGLTMIRCSSKGSAGSGSSFILQNNGAFILSTETGFIEHDNIGSTDAIVNVHDKIAFGSLAIPVLSGLIINAINTPTISFTTCAIRMDSLQVVTGLDITNSTSVSSITIDMAFRGGEAVGSIGVKGAPNSGNLLADARGLIRDSNFRTVHTPLSGITINDLKWTLRDSDGIQDTMPDSQATCMDRDLATVTINGVPIEVGGGAGVNAWLDISSSQFTVDVATGRITYIGLDPIRVPVDFGCTLVPDSGTNKNMYIYVGFGNSGDANPTARPESRSETRVDQNDPKPLSTFTQITFNTGDYVSPMVELKAGESNTDILVTNSKIRIN